MATARRKTAPTFHPTAKIESSRGSSLGFAHIGTKALIERIEAGFGFDALETLQRTSGLAINLIASVIGVPERTLARRRISGRLAPEESERLLRIANLYEKAIALFEGDRSAAVNWLSSPKKDLGNQTPLAFARTEIGAREVEDLIGRLEHGVFA